MRIKTGTVKINQVSVLAVYSDVRAVFETSPTWIAGCNLGRGTLIYVRYKSGYGMIFQLRNSNFCLNNNVKLLRFFSHDFTTLSLLHGAK